MKIFQYCFTLALTQLLKLTNVEDSLMEHFLTRTWKKDASLSTFIREKVNLIKTAILSKELELRMVDQVIS